MRNVLGSAAMLLSLSAPAYSLTVPQPCGSDPRLRCINYEPLQIVPVWSAPGGLVEIQFGEGEAINSDADVANTDTARIITKSNANHLYLKFTRCVQPEMVAVTTVTSTGERRSYRFEVQTKPPACNDPDSSKPEGRMVKLASADSGDSGSQKSDAPTDLPGPGDFTNLHLPVDALGQNGDVIYALTFRYPGDEAAKRAKKVKETRQDRSAREAEDLLRRETDFMTQDPWRGTKNLHYKTRGDAALKPKNLWDNGFLTAIVVGMDPAPVLFKVVTQGRCTSDPNRQEQRAQYSVQGDTIIASGKAQQWVLRNGKDTARDICNLAYTAVRSVPDTGTASPSVKRVIKGGWE